MNRFFLAIPVTIYNYEELQNDFNDLIKGRWVPSQNLHLTLQFFGDRFTKDLLIQKLSRLDLQIKPSEIRGLELFFHKKILYAKTDNPSLKTLHEKIQETFLISSQEEFIPHITLIRIKNIQDQVLLEQKLKMYHKNTIGILHPNIQLIQSHLGSGAAKYECIIELA